MNAKLVISILAFVISGLLLANFARAEEFTVDNRSILHFGISAWMGGTGSALVYTMQGPEARETYKWHRRVGVFTACMVPGLYKEYGIDAYPDYGDVFFDIAGCAGGIWLGEKFGEMIVAPYHAGVSVTMRY